MRVIVDPLEDGTIAEAHVANARYDTPSMTFKSITFSDGTPIELDSNDVVVLVGPNNAGKSEALNELQEHLAGLSQSKVIREVKIATSGSGEDFAAFIDEHVKCEIVNGSRKYSGYGLNVGVGGGDLVDYWPDDTRLFRNLFCRRLLTEDRINDSDPPDAIDPLIEQPTNPIHLLLLNDKTELRISKYFRLAFGEDLILYRQGGRVLPLLVGKRPTPDPMKDEDRLSSTYLERLIAATTPLQQQGDGMRSFASVILHLLAPVTPSVLLLDEPEAFLHPPQAKLIGQIMTEELSQRAQLFVATHSPDVLQGLVNGADDRLRILRIQRDGNINRVKELNKDLVKRVSGDSLMKYSSVLNGVFHQQVIVCESDSDCLFYSSILDLTSVHGGQYPDVLFVHAGTRDRMDRLAETLVALDVKVDVIVDMDILGNLQKFESIVEALGGEWSTIKALANTVKSTIEDQSPPLNSTQMKQYIEGVLAEIPIAGAFPEDKEEEIRSLFRRKSPWQAIKRAGSAAIPSGQATAAFEELNGLCKDIGLWIVPEGELESFCRQVGGHGPKWVNTVFSTYNLSDSAELKNARDFVREIWGSRLS